MMRLHRFALFAVLAILPAAAYAQTVYEVRTPGPGVQLVRLAPAGVGIAVRP